MEDMVQNSRGSNINTNIKLLDHGLFEGGDNTSKE
jgi:hypothetical protein